jgi:hypothetical protein
LRKIRRANVSARRGPGNARKPSNEDHHHVVPVSVIDCDGNEVVHADITTWVTPAG